MKVIETQYKGYRFRSRLEARWAVFFDACGVKWEYEPEGFDLGDGLYYLPDFLLHDVWIRNAYREDLWVEVKGVMNEIDAEKIIKFNMANIKRNTPRLMPTPILVVTNIPAGDEIFEFYEYIFEEMESNNEPYPFSFETIDGDYYTALPCITPQKHFAIVGSDYREDIDDEATEKAYRLARQARFEHRPSKK